MLLLLVHPGRPPCPPTDPPWTPCMPTHHLCGSFLAAWPAPPSLRAEPPPTALAHWSACCRSPRCGLGVGWGPHRLGRIVGSALMMRAMCGLCPFHRYRCSSAVKQRPNPCPFHRCISAAHSIDMQLSCEAQRPNAARSPPCACATCGLGLDYHRPLALAWVHCPVSPHAKPMTWRRAILRGAWHKARVHAWCTRLRYAWVCACLRAISIQ